MNSGHIRYQVEDSIAHIVFDRPAKKNALLTAMYTDLIDAIRQAEHDADVRAMLFYGAGDNFTAGNDLGDFLHQPPINENSPVMQFLFAVLNAHKPLVAAVEGVAIGVGTTLLMHCDLSYASLHARFQLPFVNLGLCPEAASSVLLPQRAGMALANELLLLGEAFDADTALRAGILTRVVGPGDALDVALGAARTLAAKPPQALRTTKALLRRSFQGSVADAMLQEAGHFGRLLQQPEAREAFSAFLEKRPADFSKFR